MPEDILNNIRAFVRNQSASSLMQMMQTNHAVDIALREAELILNMINSTIHHSQDSNQTVSNTTHHSDHSTIQNQTVTHTAYDSHNTQTWQDSVVSDFLINKINFCWRQAFASYQTWLPQV